MLSINLRQAKIIQVPSKDNDLRFKFRPIRLTLLYMISLEAYAQPRIVLYSAEVDRQLLEMYLPL